MENEKINVLLIEDNPGDARLVQETIRSIEGLNIHLLFANTLDKALKYIATELIHVILLDLNLPDSKGLNTFQQVYKFALNVPIIILSVVSDKEMIYEALKQGAQHYLIKGKIENDALACAIRYALWKHFYPA